MLAAVAEAVRKQPAVAAAYVYGSAARGRATPISDMDVALLFMEDSADPEERRLVASEIARSLVASMGRDTRPDVRDVEDLPLAVRGAIATEGALAASNDEVRRVRFEAETRQRYLDFLPFREATVGAGLRALRRRHSGG